ncbi:MAG: DNA polymerase III subunit chi [Rhizobiales bacterium 65-9]|nr:DNA polymerase III subunit chi [Hyphomicrobiales bacterium]OJY35665.1 MAG: DNA polymerase III subunit chi [Rhizobiales bacterium 65-9]
MTEVLFYHLERQPLEAVLPKLLERSLDRGWKVVVQAVTRERVDALDSLLWTYDDQSFLPHAADSENDIGDEAIVLTTGPGNPNGANVRFLIEGAGIPSDISAYQRVVLMFDGGDDEAVGAARLAWKGLRTGGHDLTYWQQSDEGRWERKA